MTSTLCSMTGFARIAGNFNGLVWAWEAKSVNGKSLDMRLRLPASFESLEQPARVLANARFKRGNFQISLDVREQSGNSNAVVNEALLEHLLVVAERQRQRTGGPPIDVAALLNIRGVVETADIQLPGDAVAIRDAALLAGLESVLLELDVARHNEGERLSTVLAEQLARVELLVGAARDNPARRPDAIRQRLAEQVQRLLDTNKLTLDATRLHQEVALLATKADIQEELDRLSSHIVAARKLLQTSDAVGRKLDFLMQEFNREANTLCSKSSDISLTQTGLDLKLVIDQMREQALNIE